MTRVPEAKDLPFMLKLLDDESSVVREELARALTLMGENLPPQLARLGPGSEQLGKIRQLLEPGQRAELVRQWGFWRACQTFEDKLERGLGLIADYQTGLLNPATLSVLLDDLAEECRARQREVEPLSLARYLFQERGLGGEREGYYEPLQSNLVDVLRSGTGNPISLSCIYILVGRRLGLEIDGCNYPGHFFSRAVTSGRTVYVDCYAGGLVMDRMLTEELRARVPAEVRERSLRQPAGAQSILIRVLRNLVTAYGREGDRERANLFLYLLKTTQDRLDVQEDVRPPLFSPGQLVEHRRYDYRGVVVDYDLRCTADEDWYRSNRTQPDKQQPWYRVLVDGSDKVTYAAETSLKPDSLGSEVQHPYVVYFFSKFQDGIYFRNSLPWPEEPTEPSGPG